MPNSVTARPTSAPPGAVSKALTDYFASFAQYWLWSSLAWMEIKLRYKRSTLGPFWITISTGISIATIGPIYAELMGTALNHFFPYLATSLILWGFISESLKDSCLAFISSEGYLKDTKLPFVMFIIKDVYKNAILTAHNFIIIAVVMFFFPTDVNIPLVVLAWLVITLNLMWMGLVLAIVCTRYRDVTQIVTSLITVALFITPIMWQADRW